jgi:hypothetical protein
LELRLKQEQDRLAELTSQLSKETEARKKAELTAQTFAEKLKSTGVSIPESELASLKVQDSQTEKKLKEAVEATNKIEARLKVESQAKDLALEKLKQEIQLKNDFETKLKEVLAERTQEKDKLNSLEHIEKQLKDEKELKIRLESQWKAEIMAKRKTQTELDNEIKAKENAVAESVHLKTRIKELESTHSKRKSIDWKKGLKRLTILLSFVFAAGAGYFAYINGYVINSHFDRPVHLPFFPKAVYMPIDLIIITVSGFVAAWILYLIELIIIKGFHKKPSVNKMQLATEPQVEEIMSFSEKKPWRSS